MPTGFGLIRSSLLALVFVSATTLCTGPLAAQGTLAPGTGMLGGVEPAGRYPHPSYYLGLRAYRDGDMRTAVNFFENAARGGRRTIDGRWIDSIPALTMQAECYFELGDCVGAMELLDEVMNIVVRHRGFVGRVNWADIQLQQNTVQSKPSYLWPQARAVSVMPLPDRLTFRAGERLTEARLVQGGVIEEPTLRPIDIVEIVRTIAVASYRRRVLLGPLTKSDPGMQSVLDSLAVPTGLKLPQARGIMGSAQGAAYYAAGRDDKTSALVSSATVGPMVHPVSPVVMLSAMRVGASKPEVSQNISGLLQLASVSAALKQPEWIGPALSLAAGYSDAGTAGNVASTASQIASSMDRQSRMASMHAMTAAADAWVTAGNLDSAAKALAAASKIASKRGVDCRRIESYGAFVAMRLAAASGAGFTDPRIQQQYQTALESLENFSYRSKTRRNALTSCPRIFQMRRLVSLVGTRYGSSTAGKIVAGYSGDSPTWLWRTDPVDALAASMFDRSALHWARLKVAASAGNAEEILRATDDALADRYFTATPLGGRVHQARSMAWGTDNTLPEPAKEFRAKHPMMKPLAAAVAQSGSDPTAAAALESAATTMALQRIRLPRCALPPLGDKNPLDGVPARTAVLTFVDAGQAMVATLTLSGKVRQWLIPEAKAVRKLVGRYLQMVGVGKSRGLRLPTNDEALQQCDEVLSQISAMLVPDEAVFSYIEADRLQIVPDGPLWYLPFEAIIINEDGDRLGESMAVSYAPTPGSTRIAAGPEAAQATVAMAADSFFAPRDNEINEARIAELLDGLPAPIRLDAKEDISSGRIGEKAGHLIVASARAVPPAAPLSLVPSPSDPTGPRGTLASWTVFPHSPPATVSMFGLRTAVDQGQLGDGREIFQTLCGLRAAGVRSVLISRWAVGGESTAALIDEYVQELPMVGMSDAWARSRQMLRRTELDPAAEPLLTKQEHQREGLTGEQPLFWSGYLVSSPD